MTPIFLPDEPVSVAAVESADVPDEAQALPDELETPALDDVEDPADFEEEANESELPGEEIFDVREPLLDLESAIEKVPASLRKEMEDLLRAEFREVIHWQEPK
ncbi:hypothetical protein G0Q06_00580 [Puniceicoccales bacterium CK1056]|uniref:Uncharacterized protein n=1 Tax=Oceanipulchritudo coccoides TaxID=2706888 RepID=A0A6B2LY19_9BACT|nr:hypothetical protein [Oceanipulchritudo coccoides]NDV60939.1 hypothetical protein [Oceanipulchritudo coccoides]